MSQFDMLQIIRNPLMHSRPEVLPHQKHLCLGICGEFLLAIENWRQGYIHQIKEYTVLFRFTAYPNNEDENDAQLHAKYLAEELKYPPLSIWHRQWGIDVYAFLSLLVFRLN